MENSKLDSMKVLNLTIIKYHKYEQQVLESIRWPRTLCLDTVKYNLELYIYRLGEMDNSCS